MSRHLRLALIVVAAQLWAAGYGNGAEDRRIGHGHAYTPDVVVVKLAPASSRVSDSRTGDGPDGVLRNLVARCAPELMSFSARPTLGYWIGRTAPDADIEALCRRLRSHPSVVDASPDYLVWSAEIVPDDPRFQQQYALRNTGQVFEPSSGLHGTPGSDIKASHACEYAHGLGSIIVAPTGNQGSFVLYPAAYDDCCLAVAATDANDERPQWSNSGPQVDIAAPGHLVLGARINPADPSDLSSYDWASGTSNSAAYVAGAAALLISSAPYLSRDQIIDYLKSTADDVNRSTHPGVDDFIGHGRLNLHSLLTRGAQSAVEVLGPVGRMVLALLIAIVGIAFIVVRRS